MATEVEATNRLGVHALVWVGGWSEGEARRAVAATAAAGYDLIELPAIDPGSFDADMTARLLEEHGLSAAVSLGLDDETDVSSEDANVVAAGRRRLGLVGQQQFHRSNAGQLVREASLGQLRRQKTPGR